MPTPQFRSQLAAALVGLLGAAFLVHSLAVHPQEAGDKPSATQSKESSSGASSGATTTQAGAASQAGAKLNQTDERMMKQLAESNLAEISTGKLAQEKAQSEEVKSFAKKMVDDHTKSLEELRQLAQSKGVTLPTEPNRQQMAMEKKLSGLSGDKFDRQYMQQAGDRAHKDTHKLLQRASTRSEDTDLKNYASKALGTVESHQQMAKDTTQNLKATREGKSGSGAESSGGSESKSKSKGGSKEGGSSGTSGTAGSAGDSSNGK